MEETRLLEKITILFAAQNTKLESLETKMDTRFDRIDRRFVKIEEKLTEHDRHFEGIEEKLTAVSYTHLDVYKRQGVYPAV